MNIFVEEFQDYVETKKERCMKQICRTKEWKELTAREDELREKIDSILSKEYKEDLWELLVTVDKKAVLEQCISYENGLVDGIIMKRRYTPAFYNS